jgi:hypothetical protein
MVATPCARLCVPVCLDRKLPWVRGMAPTCGDAVRLPGSALAVLAAVGQVAPA